MESSEARLNFLSEANAACAVCGDSAHWALENARRRAPLCDACAATVVFSSIETTAQLLKGKSGRERDTILFQLWVKRTVAA